MGKPKYGNILITSLSRKIPHIQCVRRAARTIDRNIKIIGGDCDNNCIGRHFVDIFWKMNPTNEISLSEIINYCHDKGVRAIIPTRDGELMFWAMNKRALAEQKINVMVSESDTINLCLDKMAFYEKGKQIGYPTIMTTCDIDGINDKWFVVKERYGSASRGAGIKLKKLEAINHKTELKEPIFQPYIEGVELSIDLYVTKSRIVKGVIPRTRDVIIRGESQITTTVRNGFLEEMCSNFARDIGVYGHACLQVIIDRSGQFHLLESNARIGGASTLSISAGLDTFSWFILESNNTSVDNLSFHRAEKELRLIRYPKDLITKQ